MHTIYFADLTHTAQGIQAKCMPLGAALVASYIKQQFMSSFDVSLYKIPKDLELAVLENRPDILCVSIYAWNLRLTMALVRLIKRINPQLIIIAGGPNFPYNEHERQNFLKEHDCIDFYIFGEGEMAAVNLLQEILAHNLNMDVLKSKEIEMINCSYLTNDQNKIISGKWTRTFALDQFPCPYIDGLMDKFFDLPLIPLYETTRGCPFSCTFCTDGISEKTKIFRRSHQNIRNSLSRIAQKIKHSDTLIISDLNFGMYNEDIETARIIARQKEISGFPINVGTAIGKSRPENIMQAVKILDGSLHIGLSFQSTDVDVLKIIKRKNVKTSRLIAAAENLGLRDSVNYTEIILALPGDSLSKHFITLKEAVDLGMTNIKMFQLMLLTGSDMNTIKSRKTHGLKTKWRVMANCAGVYHLFGSELRVAEIEEIVVSNSSMTFNDYVECRFMDFIIEVFINNNWYAEIFALLKTYDLSSFDFLLFIKERRELFPYKMTKIFDSFIEDTCKDLFVNKNDIETYILGEGILEKHVIGELGNNEILDHKALCYLNFEETTKFIFSIFHLFLSSKIDFDETSLTYLTDLEKFILCRKNNIMDTDIKLSEKFHFDFDFIAKENYKIDPHDLAITENKLEFSHNKKQRAQIKKALKLYGGSLSGMGRFIQRSNMDVMFRHFESHPA